MSEAKTIAKIHHGYGIAVRDERDITVCKEVISRDCYRMLMLPTDPDVVIDIGAHIGSFAHLAHTLYPHAKIVCVEPTAANFSLLEQNAPFASLHRVAMWYGAKQPCLYHTEAQTGSDIVTDHPDQYADFVNALGYEYSISQQHLEVSTLSTTLLNAELDFAEKTALLKLDCEGAEVGILHEIAAQNIGHYFTYVTGEWHHDLSGSREELEHALSAAFHHLLFTITNYGINSLFHSW
jgi:FkbM family methyltransferase